MPLQIRWSLALPALALVMVAPAWAVEIEPRDPVATPAELATTPENPAAPDAVPSLESQLAGSASASAQGTVSCPIQKCNPSHQLCPSDCICRIINCQVQCLPLPLRPDSCQ